MLSRFHLVPERNGQTDRRTDGRTDRFAISISRVSMLTRDKNERYIRKDTYLLHLPFTILRDCSGLGGVCAL